ncbi:MAG: helix-turn-helix domain-containing protein [Pantoea sp.]|uniref:helix-turn-helix domain-containing protein n=1 Tax=unclassified Pantoea TaxID=2630326 RepID=UPI0023A0B94A|nr:helix-turn-helix domain-containing protein [Pantoea sp.]MDE1188709.1 helix-turn-helix domain-containing protein [Pantoea sp.]
MDINVTFMHQLLIWIEANIEQKLILETVAQRAGYSQWHLQRLFRRYTGLALGAYIRERKLTASVIELLSGNTPLMHIALQFGFDSQQTYCRTFRRMFNLPPGAFRRKYQHSLPPMDGPASLLMLHSHGQQA